MSENINLYSLIIKLPITFNCKILKTLYNEIIRGRSVDNEIKFDLLDNNICMSFNFALCNVSIDHKLIDDLGEFTVFCMKALSEGLSINDISKITLLSPDHINSQLYYIQQKKYINEDNKLTDKGNLLVKLLEFKEKYKKSIQFYVDCYLDNEELKILFSPEIVEKFPFKSEESLIIQPLIKGYRITKIVNGTVFRDIIVNYLMESLPEYKELIKTEKENFIFDITCKEFKNISLEFSVEEIMQAISYEKTKGIMIAIPAVVVESSYLFLTHNDNLNNTLSKRLIKNDITTKKIVVNLINGCYIDKQVNLQKSTNVPEINKRFKIEDLVLPEYKINTMRLYKIPSVSRIKKSYQEGYVLCTIQESKLLELFKIKIANVLGKKDENN